VSFVMVTGGSGFIGSHVVDALLAAGHAVRNFDLRDSPYHDRDAVETVIGDLTDVDAVGAALEGCDAVIHLAAHADVGLILEDPVGAEEANSRGTLAVLEACRRAGVRRVVYGSTIWVYGESTDDPVTEESGLGLPKHIYTASKLAGEMYCSSYAELYDLEPTILRFGIPYGPRARPATVIAAFVRKALAGEPLTLAGDGLQTRRFVYVEDLADGVVRALRPEAAGRVYNLAGTETVTIRQVAETVQDQVAETGIVHTPGRNGDFAGAEISNERAGRELGWSAATNLEQGVVGYLAWLRESPAPKPAAPPAEEPAREGTGNLALAGFCALLGTVIAYSIGLGFELSASQLHVVALTSLAGSLLAMLLSPAHSLTSRDLLAAGGIALAYTLLLALPETRHGLGLMAPHVNGVLLSALGAAIAMSSLTVARWSRTDDEAEFERAA
jgi:UDP-glucose 4-epimerase